MGELGEEQSKKINSDESYQVMFAIASMALCLAICYSTTRNFIASLCPDPQHQAAPKHNT